MISELRAVTLVPGLEPNARNAGEKRLAAGGCLQASNGIYAITIFDTDDLELFYQVERVIRHFNLTKQQEPKALAA